MQPRRAGLNAGRATARPPHCACVQPACPRLEPDSPAVPAPRSRRPRPSPARADLATHNMLPTTSQQGASLEKVTHTAHEEVTRLLDLARSSSGGTTGFEGVYSSGGGFGAELRKGAKRLRQTGFCSPFEAALERARCAKLVDLGLNMRRSSAQSLPW